MHKRKENVDKYTDSIALAKCQLCETLTDKNSNFRGSKIESSKSSTTK
jgi:hypothetical protein